jgi:hypothetical protein
MLGAVEATLVQMTESKEYRDEVFSALGWFSEVSIGDSQPPSLLQNTLMVLVVAGIFYLRYTNDSRPIVLVVRESWPAARSELFERPEIARSIEIAKLCPPPSSGQ